MTDLEDRIADALQARADSLSPAAEAAWTVALERGHSARVAAASAALLAAAVLALVFVAPSGHRRSLARVVTPPPTDAAVPLRAPVNAGSEVPLSVDTSDASRTVISELRGFFQRNVVGVPIALRSGNHAAVVVYSDVHFGLVERNMTITESPCCGYEGGGAGEPDARTTVIAIPDTGPAEYSRNTTVYLSWTRVPAGTAYVTYTYGPEKGWQRPIDGIVVFTHPGPRLDNVKATMVAFDRNGRRLGEAQSGQWP